MSQLLFAVVLVALAWTVALATHLPERWPNWRWYLAGYPRTALRVMVTWRKVAHLNDLTVSHQPNRRLLGDLAVKGDPLRTHAPRCSFPRPTPNGLSVRVRLHAGQTPAPFLAAAEALVHAWRVHAVRIVSPERGVVLITATASDPLEHPDRPTGEVSASLLSAVVGALETGGTWVMDFRRVPHWLIVGATRSGKSTLIARLITELAAQPVALVGIDCKGGMELGLFQQRLSALATCRSQAVAVLGALVVDMQDRMRTCRAAGARSIWELPEKERPVPVVVVVDEIAELYLTNGTKEQRAEAEQCSTYLLRLAQLGAALGMHLVVAGQRVGSDLGPGVTALRAQLSGRVCHRVNDPGTAEMTLGDLNKDAVAVAQSIGEAEQGVAVTTGDTGGWMRGRSHLTTPAEAQVTAAEYAGLAFRLAGVVRALEELDGGEGA
ncbi:cell division protein FtsK [Streptomyces sp. SID8361]|uniref:FtsK/SpoIIIE domain-containing protein n=1 Tax=Streptomyces sp. MnatMP-M27 TaxID=1839768 RepID=UPI00081DC520|nr:FtsK/SpoIIIE domain-containing protein [Streptomyces sp. MnatMP-M27]MYU12967.1 cell division protein FtsK [Streptomyces sp. SID8361]SCF96637.1 DNA segregation ATPase FtsK/SpoIIIE, S-DNA-T family [Streptomyces sp. MnatMP-M27]